MNILDDDSVISNDEEDVKKSEREAACWVVRKERDGRLRWRLLPLHAALIFNAPVTVVEILLRAFPAAATLKDDQGMLPLHLACRNAPVNFEVLEELLTAYPAAVYVKDRKGRTPLQGGLAATGSDKNPGLSAMELYTQIWAAGEKQRWKSEQEQHTSQKVQSLTAQHKKQMSELKDEHERELTNQREKYSSASVSLTSQLQATRAKYEALKQDQALVRHSGSSSSQQEEVTKLMKSNRQLEGLVQILLDQHAALQESLQTLQKDQDEWQTQRNTLMRQYTALNEKASATSQAHACIWQEELSSTQQHIQQVLKQLPSRLTGEEAAVGSASRPKSTKKSSKSKAAASSSRQNESATVPTTEPSSLDEDQDEFWKELEEEDAQEESNKYAEEKKDEILSSSEKKESSNSSLSRKPVAVITSLTGAEVVP